MANVVQMTVGTEAGLSVQIEYNEGNRRITQVSWEVLGGYAVRARIWQNGSLVVDRTVGGPASGAESVQGNHRVVEVTDEHGTFIDLPPALTYQFNIESVGS